MTADQLAGAGYQRVSSYYFRQGAEIRSQRYWDLGIKAVLIHQPRLEAQGLGKSWDVWTPALLPGDVALSHDLKEIKK